MANLEIKSLSVENTSVPQNPFELKSDEAKNIGFEISDRANFWLGYYNEPRLIYTAPASDWVHGKRVTDERFISQLMFLLMRVQNCLPL